MSVGSLKLMWGKIRWVRNGGGGSGDPFILDLVQGIRAIGGVPEPIWDPASVSRTVGSCARPADVIARANEEIVTKSTDHIPRILSAPIKVSCHVANES